MAKSKTSGSSTENVALAAMDKMGEIDPMAVIIMAAAGTAGLAGIPGPLTNILDSLSEGKSPIATVARTAVYSGLGGVSPILTLIALVSQEPSAVAQSTNEGSIKAVGIAASNVVEAGLMYTLVRNPKTFETVSDIVKSVASKTPVVLPI